MLNSARLKVLKVKKKKETQALLFTGEVKCHLRFQYPRRSMVVRRWDKGQSYCLMEVGQFLCKTPSLVLFEKLK